MWTVAMSVQKKAVADPMPAMPEESALYTADHWPHPEEAPWKKIEALVSTK